MILQRDIFKKLREWKDNPDKKPLIIQGARQTGKTWCMKEFGNAHYKKTAYFNFESDVSLRKEFEKSKDPVTLINIMELYCGFPITSSDTLIIFDEVQECNEALNSLKYFSEQAPQYNIICAGSLLGVALRKEGSFPVGRVEFLSLYPLTFLEFLHSADSSLYENVTQITSVSPLPEFIFEKLSNYYISYQICGGMPKPVCVMLEENDVRKVDYELELLLQSYSLDFKKHASVSEVPKITRIWDSLPAQLAKENRKFIYGVVRPEARAREYESALEWLELAGLVYKINDISTPGYPLKAYDNNSAFKIYLFDIGILRVLSQLPSDIFLSSNLPFREFKGAFAENAVLQNLVPDLKVTPRYWTSAGKAEVDFVIQGSKSIYPVEVKASVNTSGKSLKVYMEKYKPECGFVISAQNFQERENIIHIPHFLSSLIPRFIQ